MQAKNYDAIVVGSGATGGFAAKELTEQGLEVLLLEAGPALDESVFKRPPLQRPVNSMDRIKAGIQGQPTQARCSWFSPDKKELFVNDLKNPYTTSSDDYLWVRGRQVGGRFLSWGRVGVRMSDYDFKAASRDGIGEDWPISYEDLAPYYDRVESFLQMVGRNDGIENLPDGNFTQEAGLSSFEQKFKETIQARWSDRQLTPWRYAPTSATHGDSTGKTRSTSPIEAAKATGRLTLRPNSIVTKLNVDEQSGLAAGVMFIDAESKVTQSVSANIVMMCASTIETIRILLNSGVANSSGLVGQYFMDQTNGIVFGTVPGSTGFELVDGKHPGENHGGFLIPRFQNMGSDKRDNFARGFNIQGMAGRIPVPDFIPTLFGLTVQGEMLPNRANQITVNKRKTDAWGVPVANVNITMRENERNMADAQMRTILEMVKEMGWSVEIACNALGIYNKDNLMKGSNWFERTLFRLTYKRSVGFGSAIHECGGARMGTTAENSVLNAYNQSWDVPNLFITDSSCFMTNGSCGPTLTTMALTVRAAEYIAKEYKGSPSITPAV